MLHLIRIHKKKKKMLHIFNDQNVNIFNDQNVNHQVLYGYKR